MNKWTKEWPTKSGVYWFYGWPFGDKNYPAELNLVRVIEFGNGPNGIIREGAFWYKSEGGIGLFCKAELPESPNKQLKEEFNE
jgi:hypothetical protein